MVAGPDRVEGGRVNDPSRRHPGDVCVRAVGPPDSWEKAIEVRDKPVTLADVQLFVSKCLAEGVGEAAVADGQRALDLAHLAEWAAKRGIGVTVFVGWSEIVEQALFWAGEPKPEAARRVVRHVHDRLIEVEASPESVAFWAHLTGRASAGSCPPPIRGISTSPGSRLKRASAVQSAAGVEPEPTLLPHTP